MGFLTPIAWVFAMIGVFLMATIIFAFLGIAFLSFAALLLSVGSQTGE